MALDVRSLGAWRGERAVLAGVSFVLEAGEALLVEGPNGVGKTTLLRVLAALARPREGRLTLNGVDAVDERERYAGALHFVAHRDGVKAAFTVAENLRFWAALLNGSGRIDNGPLAALGLESLADLPAAYLSAGQRRRLALARLLAVPRPLWLLDEPAQSLDAAGRRTLGELIARHRQGGGLVVMASHGDLLLPDARRLTLGHNP